MPLDFALNSVRERSKNKIPTPFSKKKAVIANVAERSEAICQALVEIFALNSAQTFE